MRAYNMKEGRERSVSDRMKTIIFDMDGVIFDTERLILSCWVVVAGKYGIPHMEDTFKKSIGTDVHTTKQILLDTYGEDFPYDTFREEYRDMFYQKVEKEGLPLKRGARELLGFLKINGYRIGLASSTRREVVEQELSDAGLLGFFETIVGGDMVAHGKPAPDIYEKACEKLKVKPEEAYAVEDSKNGMKAAKAAGLKVIHVPDLLEPDEEMIQMSEEIFEDLMEVRNFLAR